MKGKRGMESAADFPVSVLTGVGQVMLQNSALTGILFLAGIFFNSWLMCAGALLGAIAGTVAAHALNYKNDERQHGLYGFNGTLVGIALFFFFQPSLLLFLFIILGAALSSIVMNFMLKMKIPPYTFPFVICTWLLIAIISAGGLALPVSAAPFESAAGVDTLSATSTGFGQVMFQASVVTGALFFIGVAANSRRAAAYGLFGAVLGGAAALVLSFPLNAINAGLYGFNGVLCGIAFADCKKFPYLHAAAAILLSVFIMQLMVHFGIVTLTAPFVFAAWIVIAAGAFFAKK
ncbi:MAG: urea transporter [Candidatus Micrarchaeota archaeon]|nr:urea transporter [Candidatus Micrarchaeota archaeon]